MTDPNAYYASAAGAASYDALMALSAGGTTLDGDLAFYRDCAARYGGPVLELGAGTGRVALALAETGVDVVALERAAPMLDRLRARLTARPDLTGRVEAVEGDMRDFDLGRRFALVVIAARSFQHVIEPGDQRRVLRAVHRHLAPGGHLVLDLFDPNFAMLLREARLADEAPDPESGRRWRRTVIERHCDLMRQTLFERMRLEALDTAGTVVSQEETAWTLRWTLRQEMRWLFELERFAPVAEYSDFARSPPTYGREQLWVARLT